DSCHDDAAYYRPRHSSPTRRSSDLAEVQQEVADAVQRMKDEHGITPGLAAVLVGDNPASQMYVKMKRNRCAEVGIDSFLHELPGDRKSTRLHSSHVKTTYAVFCLKQ